jgi:colicin import membrane protein
LAAATAKLSEATSLSLSVLAHAALLLLLSVKLSLFDDRPDRPVRLAIDASVVLDTDVVLQRQREAERAAAEQRRREEQERQRIEAERRRAEEARLAAQREAEAARRAEQERTEAAARAERERQAAEEARKAAEAAAQAERERKAAEAAARAERERKAAEEAARKAAEAAAAAERRRQAEREAQLLAQLAAEEERESAVSAGLLEQWRELIRQRIQRNWVKPASAGAGINCEVRVTQIPGGEVVDVQVTSCNGDDAVVRSIENAVLRASPLPPPPDPALFERRLVLDFKPKD